jgi:hypothetical protein
MILMILSDTMVKIYRKRIQIAPAGFEIDRVVKPAIETEAEKVYLMVSKDKTEKDYAAHKRYFTLIQKKLKAESIETELVECDRLNIDDITRTARDLILKEADSEIAINLASGSKLHGIGLDRACMTFRKRDKISMFYPKPKKYKAVKYPDGQSSGLAKDWNIKVAIHRIIVPEPELIDALKIIRHKGIDIPLHTGKKGIKKKDLAKACYGDSSKVNLTKLQRNITQKLAETWRAIETIKVGQSDWISLTDEGKYLRKILKNEESY